MNGELQYSECRSCKAKVAWIQLDDAPAGKDRVIVDAQPIFLYALQPSGNFRLVQCFRSHFATCPDADRWRKKKEGQNNVP